MVLFGFLHFNLERPLVLVTSECSCPFSETCANPTLNSFTTNTVLFLFIYIYIYICHIDDYSNKFEKVFLNSLPLWPLEFKERLQREGGWVFHF